MSDFYDTVIIGSGPAGLAAAYSAGKAGKKAVILERTAKPALKLLASGGGRCNVSNTLPKEEFAMRFGRSWRFMLPALSLFHGNKLLEFFRKHQLPLTAEDGFHYFPASGSARDVRDLFLREIRETGGKLFCNCQAEELIPGNDGTWQVITQEQKFHCSQVIWSGGGRSYPALSGSMSAYLPISRLGHKITPLYPAMTGVIAADSRIGECAGIALPDTRTTLLANGKKIAASSGELLFTHRGFSAFAILDLAGETAKLLDSGKNVTLKIDFLPAISRNELHQEFLSWRQTGGTRHISSLLSSYFPRRLAQWFLAGNDPEISRWPAKASTVLEELLKGAVFQLSGVEGWDKAMVTAGGVSLKEVDPDTLESKLFPGLFFAGEVLDITGPCGGFNISWALASGMLAGM